MRISTAMQYNNHLTYLQNANSKLDQASMQYNTGLKFQTAGQNPSGMASKIKYTSDIAAYEQYAINAGIVSDHLSQEETALGQIWDTLASIKTRLIQAVNGTMDDGARAALAEDIKQSQAQLFNLMNTKNAEGEYIFSGSKSDTPTYTITTDGKYVCQADGSNKYVLVSPTNKVQTTDSGLNIFENVNLANSFGITNGKDLVSTSGIHDYDQFNTFYKEHYSHTDPDKNNLKLVINNDKTFELQDGSGNKIEGGEIKDGVIRVQGMEFTVSDETIQNGGTMDLKLNDPEQDNILNQLSEIIDILNTPSDEWADKGLNSSIVTQELSRMQQNVEIAMKQVDTYRGLVGARGANIDAIIKSDEGLSDIKKEARANISEVDAFTAVSELLQTQNALQVAQQSYQIVHSSSLFDFI